jgi:SSS family transporter
MKANLLIIVSLVLLFTSTANSYAANDPEVTKSFLQWDSLPALPDEIGVAGPFVGVHLNPADPERGVLIVAGGANFSAPEDENLWQLPKLYHDKAWILKREKDDDGNLSYEWQDGLNINRPLAYGASVSTEFGMVCIGGEDGQRAYSDVFLLSWDPREKILKHTQLPNLAEPVYGCAAVMIGNVIYAAGGLSITGPGSLASATRNFWSLDMSLYGDKARAGEFVWKKVLSWPGPERAFAVAVSQHNGFDQCVYVLSGRRALTAGEKNPEAISLSEGESLLPLKDVYEFCPFRYDPSAYDPQTGEYRGKGDRQQPWRRRADAPFSFMAGTGAAIGQSHIFILSGADGSNLREVFEQKKIAMKDHDHPGFSKRSLAYHTITDTWIETSDSPANQVTTPAVKWWDEIFLVSGEVRPRVRTNNVWLIQPLIRTRVFGAVNFSVLGIYLLSMVGVGVYFANKNKNTDDYFRGGQKIPWWVAGCSIFATMLSSITFMAIPAKAYAQDWVYLLGNFMIFAVAPVAVYLALPFFRKIDATSAYEYLQKRFNMPVRLFASASFTVFHIFRMGIVMSLAALALSTVADFSFILGWIGLGGIVNANALACVLIMGILSIIYCTMGGVEAVVWTDTIQTFVLLGGAILCFVLMIFNVDGGLGGFIDMAAQGQKIRVINLHWDSTSTSLALWVVLIGAFGQNISSYTADQAVVQRYMTTPDTKRAAKAIWTNAWLCIPASLLFYAIGTGLFAFYKSHPEKLDPTYMTDQIFPLFISHEVPVGIAGLIVAGIFAAAQSTISTSMNSTATTVVTDFLRPFNFMKTERSYLNAARGFTFTFGITGTVLGLMFVSPDIRSLFDQFIKVIGLFMGVLGGLFCLGILTRRANGWGALAGAVVGALVMGLMPVYTQVNGYLYAFIGISTCFIVGYVVSLITPKRQKEICGLTVHTLNRRKPNL